MDHTKLAGAIVPVGAPLTDNDKVDTAGLPSHGSVREQVLTKNPLQPETILELRHRVPNGIGVDCVNLQRLLALTRGDPGFPILTGSEFLILAGLYEAFRRGDLETAREWRTEVIGLCQVFAHGRIWGALDEGLRWLGICGQATGALYITALSQEALSC